MSVRRAFVDCAVLSVQDACLFYPNCRSCFSKLDVEQEDTNRCRCSRCGYTCLREQIDYRYRLSLKVARSSCLFGITVFGSTLNPLFGVQATALQRLVEHQDGQIEHSARVKLLLKATEDCFIGRHFIFGLKLTERESGLWFEESFFSGSNSNINTQYVASQMILPKASGLGGSTVVTYYQALLRKASEYQLGSSGLSKASRFSETFPLLHPACSPNCSLDDVRLSDSRHLFRPCQSTLNRSCSFSSTPPWQQSLGVVTSSAEQEEGDGAQGSQLDVRAFCGQKVFSESDRVIKQAARLLSVELDSSKTQSFVKCLDSPVVNRSSQVIFSQPDYKTNNLTDGFSNRLINSFTSSPAAQWEHLPFSESLTEFFGEENELCQKQTTQKDLDITEYSTAVQMLLDITNTPASPGNNGCYFFTKDCKKQYSHKNGSHLLHTCACENYGDCNLTSERKQKDEPDVDAYDCSLDLFSGSLNTSIAARTLNKPSATVRKTTRASHPSYDVTSESPDSLETVSSGGKKRDSLIPQDFDFVPPSQSTPIVKVAHTSNSYKRLKHRSSFRCQKTNENLEDSHSNLLTQKFKNSSKNLNPVGSNQKLMSKPVRRLRKTMKCKQQQRKEHRGAPLPMSLHSKLHSVVCDESVCDGDYGEMLVPPTPAGKEETSVLLKTIPPTQFWSGNVTTAKDKHEEEHCQKTLLDNINTPSHTGVESIGNGDDLACDWSRDLFSDSHL